MKTDTRCKCYEAVMDEIIRFLNKGRKPDDVIASLEDRGYKTEKKVTYFLKVEIQVIRGVNHLDPRKPHRISVVYFPVLDKWLYRCKMLCGNGAATT